MRLSLSSSVVALIGVLVEESVDFRGKLILLIERLRFSLTLGNRIGVLLLERTR